MQAANVTAYRLSKEISVSESLFSRWQKDPDIEPSSTVLKKLSDYFQVSMEWLLTGEGEMSRNADAARPVIDAPSPEETAELRRYFDRLPTFKRGKVVGYAQLLADTESEAKG